MVDSKDKGFYCRTGGFGRRAVARLLFFSLLWFLLTGFDFGSLVLGGPAVLLAVGVSLFLAPESRHSVSLAGACLFVPFFLAKSMQSGIDVMRRTLAVRPLVNPGLVAYTTSLPEGAPRILFANTISLLPGTLSVDLEGRQVIVHAIDQDMPVWASLQSLEQRVALIFLNRTEETK